MRCFITCILLLFFTEHAYTQTEIPALTDSLEKLLTQNLPDSQRLRVINHLTYYYNDVNTERFLELSEEGLNLANKVSDKRLIGVAYMNGAMASEVQGDYIASLAYNAKALQVFQSAGDSIQISSVLNNIGIAYNQMGDYSMAVYYFLKAAEVDEYQNDSVSRGIVYINLAECYYNTKNYATAIDWARQSIALVKNTDESSLGYATEMLAMAFIEVDQYDSTRHYVKRSRAIAEKYNNEYLFNRTLSHLGKMHLRMKNYDSAHYYLTKTIQQSKGKHLSDVLLPATLSLSQCLWETGKSSEALTQAHWAYKSSLEIKNKILALQSAVLLAEIYESLQKKDETIQYLKVAADLREKIMEQSIQGSLQAKAFDIVLEKEKKEKQAAVYSLEQSGKVLVRQRFLLTVGAVVVTVLVALLYLLRKINRQRRVANEQLTRNNLQLSKLNQEINGLIHTIVHDLKSPLNSVQGILTIIQHEVKNPSVTEMIALGHKAIANGHEIIRELLELRELEEKPLALQLETVSLKVMVEEIAAEHAAYANQKKITLTTEAPDIQVQLDRQLMKRLITNLVSNAVKFSAEGKPVFLQAQTTGNKLVFEVKDEGPGFQPSDLEKIYSKFQRLSARPTGGESSHGLGLAIVDLLVKRLNASIDLKTEYGKGSTFIVTVPVT